MEAKASWYTSPEPLIGEQQRTKHSKWRTLGVAVILSAVGFHLWRWEARFQAFRTTVADAEPVCPQTSALLPVKNAPIASELTSLYGTQEFRESAISWLSGAVQVPTESFDKMAPVGEDPRWEVFKSFHTYLERAFPNVHETLKLTKVNTYGLLFHWQGSDESLKPILLAGHQDVVPVEPETVDQWLQPPYSGYYDGKWIWGRGSNDDKSGVIGIMAAIESLISKGFEPTRSIVLAFGFDEEASGTYGAGSLAQTMLKVYGEHSVAMIIDEGGGFSERYGTVFAEPAVAEKGYMDTRVEVKSPGGHSSVPPKHTTIGILSALLVEYEKNPITPVLKRDTVPYATLQCLGAHAADMPCNLRHLIQKSRNSKRALCKLERLIFQDRSMKAKVGTTQAIDLIKGGVKTNALPESADAVINHRIATDSSVFDVQKRDAELVTPLAKRYNLSLTAYGQEVHIVDGPTYGSLELTDAWGTALEPAPVTPTDPDAEPYKLLSGTIIATYEASSGFKENNKPIVVTPGISTGNTDTRYYWDLSRHIFRYNHKDAKGDYNGAHTVNEARTADSFLEMIKFFTALILNADESTSI